MRQVLKCMESASGTIIREWHPQGRVPSRLDARRWPDGLERARRIIGICLIAGRFLLGRTLNQIPDDEIAKSNWDLDDGYSHVQSTKPQTLGYALNDSSVGLAPRSSRSSELGVIARVSWSGMEQPGLLAKDIREFFCPLP